MATMQQLNPCPRCETVKHLSIYKYENGWQHVECDKCFYLGPGEGAKIEAARSHNKSTSRVGRANQGNGGGG